jgi:hypothetical protein
MGVEIGESRPYLPQIEIQRLARGKTPCRRDRRDEPIGNLDIDVNQSFIVNRSRGFGLKQRSWNPGTPQN